MTNYFQSFDLTPNFAIDQAALEASADGEAIQQLVQRVDHLQQVLTV